MPRARQPLVEVLRGAIIGGIGDEPNAGSRRARRALPPCSPSRLSSSLVADIADMREGEGDQLPGIGGDR